MQNDVLNFVLNGLQEALELERELGVRSLEIDRRLLVNEPKKDVVQSSANGNDKSDERDKRDESVAGQAAGAAGNPHVRGIGGENVARGAAENSHVRGIGGEGVARGAGGEKTVRGEAKATGATARHDLIFVHHQPLSEKGTQMMAAIITAMGRAAENTPVIVAPPLPRAKITVVLGFGALKKYFPELRGGPGQWFKVHDGREVLITYSPEHILRFDTVTEAVKKEKSEMWRSLKSVMQRLRQ